MIRNALHIAETNARVLITRETGTGKDLIAQLIFQSSHRSRKPFIACNCGALSPQLAQSKLFGHEPHSFTGADPRGRQGKVQAADGGTLFLDEVADLPMVAQVALLRMLDHGEIQEVGKLTPQRVNVRVICATHRNLEKLVAEGAFREDLYYRLFVAELKLPPLREREDDVLLIAGHILNVLRIEYGRAHARKLSPEAEHLVRAFPWPGNIRQLRHVLEHAFIRTSKESLEAQDFPVLLKETPAAARVHAVRHEELQEAVAQSLGVQESALVQALGAEGGEWFSTPSIAEKLGISASSARTKLRALSEAGILESAGDKRARRYRLSQTYTLDFSDQNSDIMEIGKLG